MNDFNIVLPHRRIVLMIMIPLLIVFFTPHAFANASSGKQSSGKGSQPLAKNWTEAIRVIEQENDRFRKVMNRSLSAVRAEQAKLRAIKRDLAKKTAVQEKQLERQRKAFNKLLKREEQLIVEIDKENEDLKTLEGTVRAAAKEADTLVRENPTSFETTGRNALLSALLSPDHYPSLREIRNLTDLFFEEAILSSQVKIRQGKYIGKGGGIEEGEIIRLGTFTTYYRKGGPGDWDDGGVSFLGSLKGRLIRFWSPEMVDESHGLGFLRPDTASNRMVAVPERMPQQAETSLLTWLSGEADAVPLDVSRGAIFRLLNTEKGLKETLAKGGVIAWLILFIGLIAVVIGLERLFVLVRAKKMSEKSFTQILEQVADDQIEACLDTCRGKKRAPTYRVLERILGFAHSDRNVLENAAEEAVMKEMPRLERFMSTLGVLYAIAPLLGLLGTVTGMINTFQVISAFGTGDPKMMSGGISEALITTQLGLAVAVPIMLFHHYLERKVDAALADMEEKSASLTVALMEKNSSDLEPTDVDHAA